MKAGT